MATYTRTTLKERINASIKGKIGILIDANETIESAVRTVVSEIDMRSTRRSADNVSGLFGDIYEYPLPVDLKGMKIMGVHSLSVDSRQDETDFVTSSEFKARRKIGSIAIDESNNIRKLLAAFPSTTGELKVSSLDTTAAGGGAWTAFGDGDSVETDTADYVSGAGSIKFGISGAGGTTAGIVNSTLDTFDYSPYADEEDAIFVWVKVADPENLTNFVIRYGDSAAVYNQIVVTTTHFGTAFAAGWNLLRFDIGNKTTVGSPDVYAGAYVALYMTKTAGKINETGYRFDEIIFRSGVAHKVLYYSKYAWRDAITGALKDAATSDNDILVVDSDEYDLFLDKAVEYASEEVDEANAMAVAAQRYERRKKQYQMDNPSEAAYMTHDYQAQYYV